MLDFTSALYLDMRHPHATLAPWQQLTTGHPAAFESSPAEEQAAQAIAQLLGCEQAVLGASTLHIFWDLFHSLSQDHISVYLDDGTYPIVRWAVAQVATNRVPVMGFRKHDVAALEYRLTHSPHPARRPVVVCDGLDPASGRPAPLERYLALVKAVGGYLVIDDTQALGVLGQRPSTTIPYGTGGGGTAAWYGLRDPALIIGASLAKGFGVPIAVLAGSQPCLARLTRDSLIRVHCSPPSAATWAATNHALGMNERRGDWLRKRLLQNVRRFRDVLVQAGLRVDGGFFPVQTPRLGTQAQQIHERLQAEGIRTVLHRERGGSPAQLSFLINAAQTPQDIDHAAERLAAITTHNVPQRGRKVRNHGQVTGL
ncbi:MAG: hypothetical protein BWK73_06730 [Thiothrix lacustris]|uniref:Aminotransferase class I/classII large domain-containing protein n=1 Tax=Thiothrix lacustris TaxID=525917 RepID=A0A1Y1QWF4_9GAMM|nr:MAG: hypothetical protein BWK73_06730 [Thiothrix lacustris]